MGNATTIADKCRDAVNAHHNCGRASFVCKGLRANDLSYCADQFLNNMLQCNSYASEQCMNCCSATPTADCDASYNNVVFRTSLPF